jgi:hypothetical protein
MQNLRGKSMSRNVDIEKLRETTEKMVKELKISDEEYTEMTENAEKEMEERGNIPDGMLEYFVLKRVQLALKVRTSGSRTTVKGFFIGAHPKFDFAAAPRQKVIDFIETAGKAKAIELDYCDTTLTPLSMTPDELKVKIAELGEAEAQKAGYMNADGEYLYVNDKFRNGQVVPEHDWNRVGYGVFEFPGEDELKMATVNIRGDTATKAIPLFQIVEFSGRINQKKSTNQHIEMSMSSPITLTDEYVNYWYYDDMIKEAVPKRRLENLESIINFVGERQSEFKRWAIVTADVMEVGIPMATNNNVPINVTDYSLSSYKSAEPEITFWMDKNLLGHIRENDLDAVLIVSPYIKKDGTISGNLIGYWVDGMDNPRSVKPISDEDLLKEF